MSAVGLTLHDVRLRQAKPALFRDLDAAVRRAIPRRKLCFVQFGLEQFGPLNMPASVVGYLSDIGRSLDEVKKERARARK